MGRGGSEKNGSVCGAAKHGGSAFDRILGSRRGGRILVAESGEYALTNGGVAFSYREELPFMRAEDLASIRRSKSIKPRQARRLWRVLAQAEVKNVNTSDPSDRADYVLSLMRASGADILYVFFLRMLYRPGTLVRLDDRQTIINEGYGENVVPQSGTIGLLAGIQDDGKLDVDWPNNCNLPIIPHKDSFTLLAP